MTSPQPPIPPPPTERLRTPGLHNSSIISDDGSECLLRANEATQGYHFMGKTLELQVRDALQPLAERWAGGVELVFDNAYGIRRYRAGAWLGAHVDVTSQ